MKAVWLEEVGGPEVLVAADASDPVPGPGQALIEVSFANITFVETDEQLAVRAATSENPLSGCSTVVAEWSVSLTQPSSLAPPWARHCSLPDQRRYCTRLARFTRKENNEDNRC